MKTNDFTKTEKKAIVVCGEIQQMTEVLGKNLTLDIRQNAGDLVRLYKISRILDELRKILPKEEVIDNKTGKSLGFLYTNEYIEGVMLATNIRVGYLIRHTERHLRKISCAKYL